ncbi:helix-turn-helix transcriptional regulator [Streptomyces sp. MNU76]|uniref:helix-turn-helix domain-containing protein n=1 Tax=Streptomyces sp. MNU76 TaxID=2560026 RepID=UPI0035A8B5F4
MTHRRTTAAQLAEIIRDVAAGRRYVDPDIAASALTEDDCPLSERELPVLRAARAGASVAEIADEVHLAQGTVRTYLSAAMSKLGAPTRHAAAHHAAGLDLSGAQARVTRAERPVGPRSANRPGRHPLSTRPARTASPWSAASRTRPPRPRSSRRG